MKLKNIKTLKDTLYHENYDQIAFWADGSWTNVGSGYAGEQDGKNPIYFVKRVHFYGLTRREVNELISSIRKEIR